MINAKQFVFLPFLLVLISLGSSTVQNRTNRQSVPNKSKGDIHALKYRGMIDRKFGKIPLYFIPNQGQAGSKKALFYAKTSRYTLWLTREGLVFDSLRKSEDESGKEGRNFLRRKDEPKPEEGKMERDVSRLVFVQALSNPEIVPIDPAEHRVNYFIGNDPSRWKTDVLTSKAVLYRGIYKNIDLKVYGREKQIEYDWNVRPGGDPREIGFAYRDVQSTAIRKNGDLVIRTKFGELIHRRPDAYQTINGKRIEVLAEFERTDDNAYCFRVGDYNRCFNLIIDPVVLAYSTYLGGTWEDDARSIAVDSSGCAYVTGITYSPDFPINAAFQENFLDGPQDIFISKFNSSGNDLEYSTFLGGRWDEESFSIDVDTLGSCYVTGYTGSDNFPMQNPIRNVSDGIDIFITKFNPSGNGLVFSTYFGSTDGIMEYGYAIKADGSGASWITGFTGSPNFPLSHPFQNTLRGSQDAILCGFDSSGGLLYSSYLGGSSIDTGIDLFLSADGYVMITGTTASTDFPTENKIQDYAGGNDLFLTKIDPEKNEMPFSTFFGGSGYEAPTDLFADSSGNAFLTGRVNSTDFPLKNQFQNFHGDGTWDDTFITKIDTYQYGLVYSTCLGGTYEDYGEGISVDSTGAIYVAGYTFSDDFPLRDPYQPINKASDVFLCKLTPSGNALVFSTFFGGSYGEMIKDMRLDSQNAIYICGSTNSNDFPVENPFDGTWNGSSDGFVTKLIPPALNLLSPNGFENWQKGSVHKVTWDASGTSAVIKLVLFKDGVKVGNIVTNIPVDDKFYDWTVGNYIGGTVSTGGGYVIRAITMDGIHKDESDNPFSITPPSVLNLTSPNGGETWQLGRVQPVTWSADGISGNVKLVLFQNGVKKGNIVTDLHAAGGTYSWTVGSFVGGIAGAGNGYSIRVITMDGLYKDESDAPFSISELRLTTPNGGESWPLLGSAPVSWIHSGISGNMKLVLFQNGVKLGNIVLDLVVESGNYSWTVGNYIGGTASAGSGYVIRAITMDGKSRDENDLPFGIY